MYSKFNFTVFLFLVALPQTALSQVNLYPFATIYEDQGRNEPSTIGSGFLISHNDSSLFFLTAYHVVETINSGQLKIKLCKDDTILEGNIAKYDPHLDLALIKSSNPFGPRVPIPIKFSSENLNTESSITILGNPIGISCDHNSMSKVKSIDLNGDTRFFTVQPFGIQSGYSGGPVLDGNENLLGLVKSVNSSWVECLSIQSIMEVLKKWNISFARANNINKLRTVSGHVLSKKGKKAIPEISIFYYTENKKDTLDKPVDEQGFFSQNGFKEGSKVVFSFGEENPSFKNKNLTHTIANENSQNTLDTVYLRRRQKKSLIIVEIGTGVLLAAGGLEIFSALQEKKYENQDISTQQRIDHAVNSNNLRRAAILTFWSGAAIITAGFLTEIGLKRRKQKQKKISLTPLFQPSSKNNKLALNIKYCF